MHTLEKFLAGSVVRLRCQELALNGHDGFLIAELSAAQHYQCELHGSNGNLPVTMIIACDDGPPDVAEVLDAAAAMAAVIEGAGGYEEWALQMGFDPDSRRGERVYRTERRQARRLRALLGEEPYRELLWGIDRL